jgi:hypothetical protein
VNLPGIADAREAAHDMSGTQRRVTGKRHFEGGRKDAHALRCARLAAVENERRFRQIELKRECLHRGGIQPLPVFEDAQRIAAERRLREDIEDAKPSR